MKEEYITPETEIILFESDDVIRTSAESEWGGGELD